MNAKSRLLINSLLFISAIIMVSLACNLPGEETAALKLDPHAVDGSVSGNYFDPAVMGDKKMLFSVTADGFATYHLEGAPETEWLAVGLNDDQTAIMSWRGIVLDGNGPLTDEEQTALDELMRGDLARGLEMIPLDIGCQGDDQIDPKQVAALLVPLQIRFKYQVTARSAEAVKLIDLSECGYGSWEDNKVEKDSVIQLSPSSPVPAVFGYFPLDEEGAVDPPASSLNEGHTACMPVSSSVTDGGIQTIDLMGVRSGKTEEFGIAPYGPCDARCRGACGADCEPNNCTVTEKLGCEIDESGRRTGMQIKNKIYECGLHQACIDHDACYDDCNFENGCDTWGASFCMRGLCDPQVVLIDGIILGGRWAYGYGIHTQQESYRYRDESFGKQQNLDACPIEDEPTIPVGNYKGFVNVDGWFFETDRHVITEVITNWLNLVVSKDGTVTGSMEVIYDYEFLASSGDLVKGTYVYKGTFNGTLADFKGAVNLVLRIQHSASSGDGWLEGDDTMDLQAFINIIEGQMSGSVGYYEGDDYFSFDAHRE